MTKDQFMKREDVSPWQFESWFSKGWIRGARKLEDGTVYIPEGAIKPYAKRNTKCKDGIGLYSSIIRGISQGYDVFPELYNTHPVRFNAVIQQLLAKEYITQLEIDSITYYFATTKCLDCKDLTDSQLRKHIKDCLDVFSPVIKAASEGAVSAIIAKK